MGVELLMYLLGLQRNSMVSMALAVQELVAEVGDGYDSIQSHVQALWQRFAFMRIRTQLLMEHFLASFRKRDGFAGVFQLRGNPVVLAQEVALQSAALCDASMGQAPQIIVHEVTSGVFTYVPMHLRYVLGELFKNACRAVVEKGTTWRGSILPPVICEVEHRDEDVSMKIIDQGVGMSSQRVQDSWKFMHSSASRLSWTSEGEAGILAGYGIGLPMSRVIMRHCGGDLWLHSQEGAGTEINLTLGKVRA